MKQFVERIISKCLSNNIIIKNVSLILAFVVLNSCSTYRINRLKHKSYKEWKTYQWTEIKSSDQDLVDWTIYSRKVKGTNFLEYKIEGEIASSPESCIATFRKDIYQQVDKKENKKYPIYKIVNESKDSLLTYVIHNEPFPFKDTEMSVRYLFSDNKEGDATIIWHEAWTESSVKPSKKLNRVETFRGSWDFLKESNNKTKAVNIVQFDAKKMPKWLVNPMVTNFLRKGLENLRETTIN